MEHRWGQRVAVRVPVRLWIQAGEPVPAHTQDVSISGAFLLIAHPEALGARVEVEMSLPVPFGARAERIAAYITRRTGTGVGIEWRELAPPAVRAMLAAHTPGVPYRLCAQVAHEPPRSPAVSALGMS
jgi:hypothetical protein